MSQWFECKVKYDRTLESGAMKTVTEPYLVNALSFTEAEARITGEMQPYVTGEMQVTAVRRVNLSDIFYHDGGDRWYKVKTNFITIDEKTAVEAQTSLESGRINSLIISMIYEEHFEIAAITETAIMDVFGEDLVHTAADKQ